MEFLIKNNNVKVTILDVDIEMNDALILKETKTYYEFIIIKGYKINGIYIEWNQGDYLGLFEKNCNYEEFKKETYIAKYKFGRYLYEKTKKGK